jgi:non-ribosomal peptide synthetase component F
MNRPAESTRFRVETAQEAAILRGEARDDFPLDEVLADLFVASARARPDHPALIFGAERHSYAEVDVRTDAMARGLSRRGIGPGDVVGL